MLRTRTLLSALGVSLAVALGAASCGADDDQASDSAGEAAGGDAGDQVGSANASFGIYLPKWSGTIYELLSAPVSFVEVVLGYVGAAASKSVMLGTLILLTARAFVPYELLHPVWMVTFLLLTAVTFSLFGFIIGLWADSFQKLQVIPLMVVTPLTFLGGAFYSINMLPPLWQKVTLFNPVVYLISGFRWSFYGTSDVNVAVSFGMTLGFLAVCLTLVWWIFKTGYKLKS